MKIFKLVKAPSFVLSAFTILGLVIAFQNCAPSFKIADPDLSEKSVLPSTAIGSSKTNPFLCSQTAQQNSVQSKNPMRRLTRTQYANTLKDLIGAASYSQVSSLIDMLYDDELKKSINDFSNSISDNQMTAYQSIAEAVYSYFQSHPDVVQTVGGTCLNQAPVTNTCRDTMLRNMGLHAFRRPLTDVEVARWGSQVFSLGSGSGIEGFALSVYGMMLSPYFLLHVELGNSSSSEISTYQLTPYEVASRLSYGLTDSPPDQVLYTAAAEAKLSSLVEVGRQVDRLMALPAGRAKVRKFFVYWLDPRRYSGSNFSADFLQGLDVNAVNDEFERELSEYTDYVVFVKKGSFDDLVLGRESFARTPAAAAIYGHVPVTGSIPAIMPAERKGIFMRTPVLANDGNESHPILRGVKFRNRFLCESLGLPSGVLINDPTFFSDAARAKMSTRDRTAGLTGSNSCMGCHSTINPIGFAFENFDSLGRIRGIERSFSTTGLHLADFPIVTASPNALLGGKSVAVHDGLDVIETASQQNQLSGCFVTQVSRFYRIQQESIDDGCLLHNVYDKSIVESGAPVLEAFKQQFVQNSLLRRRIQ